MKIVGSWSKPNLRVDFIARKKVDWSVFEYGSHIPVEFLEDFEKANKFEKIQLGKRHEIILIIDNIKFDAFIANINRRNVRAETIQIRYDSNSNLKLYLIERFKTSYNYLKNERAKRSEENDKTKLLVPIQLEEFMDFYETDQPYCYKVEIITSHAEIEKDKAILRNIWWVNQGSTLNSAVSEGCLWAPLKTKNGRTQYHWETMAELRKGDIILHYSNGYIRYLSQVIEKAEEASIPESLKDDNWDKQGRLAKVMYYEIKPNISLHKISKELLELKINEGPIDSYGGVKQGYLFRFTKEALQKLQLMTPEVKWPEFSINHSNDIKMIEDNSHIEKEKEFMDIKNEVDKISSYIKSRGFIYDDDIIKNFYLALKTKPFVILAGTSGTGKSKLVKLFSEALGATAQNGRYKLVPVKPDWSDSVDLLGYRDLHGRFHPGILTSYIKSAMKDSNNPYFLCLDEMNLARVEYYFSDILSVMETRSWDGYKIITDKLLSEEVFGDDTEALEEYRDVYIPDNLYLIGTVNMDETTFPFSKKVLDRANTIEFSMVEFDYNFNDLEVVEPNKLNNKFLKSEFIQLRDCSEHEEILNRVILILKEINDKLMKANLHFGYRIRDEICYYLIYSEINNITSFNNAMDHEILQKILPRIQGSSMTIKRVLIDLFKICINNKAENFNYEDIGVNEKILKYVNDNSNIPYIKSASKLAFMMRRFEEDGFTSYWL